MLTFTLAISCLTTSNLPWFMSLTFQVPMQYCSLQHQTLLISPVTSTTRYCFCFGSIPSFFLELFLHWSPVAYWVPTDLWRSSFSVLSFFLFILFFGFSRQQYWSGCLVQSKALRPHGLQHARLPCSSLFPGVCSNSCPLSYTIISGQRTDNSLALCHPLPFLPSLFPSIVVFSSDLALWIRWPKNWSFSFTIIPSSKCSGLISFRIKWIDSLAVQWTL